MNRDKGRYDANGRLTVAVAGASSLVGMMLLERLERVEDVRTVALVRSPTTLPADEVIPDWMSSNAATSAMREADVLVNLSGEMFSRSADVYRDANVRTTELVAGALRSGRARRAILISYPGADPDSPNLFLKTKGQAERLLLASGKDAVVFRCPAIINTPDDPGPFEANMMAERGSVQTLGSGRQRWRPVYRGDVAEAISAAVERGAAGIYDLTGPEEMTLDHLIR
ncbi:MAG: SDR family oxidoreductase, partial [Rubrobacter sp.]